MNALKNFLSGFFSTLLFHQGLLYLFFLSGIVPVKPFNMTATSPLGVPSVLSLAFFGGLWGIALGQLLSLTTATHFWLKSFFFGALLPTIVAIGVVFPLKGIEFSFSRLALAFFLNGAWGLGTALFIFIRQKYPIIHKETLRTT